MDETQFIEALRERVLVFDGAMGTSIQARDLSLRDYEGHENCVDLVTASRPDVVCDIHRSYLSIGCDAVLTNTFGANKIVLGEFSQAHRTHELNKRSAEIAREACRKFDRPNRPRFVIGSIGPGTKLPSLGQATWDELLDSYTEQARGLIDGGADVLLVETCQDLLQAKSAIVGCIDAMHEKGRQLPLICTVTIETTGTMLVGTEIAAALAAIECYDEIVAFGLNCATGPQEMSEHIRYLSANCSRPLIVQPNAGLPQLVNGKPYYALTPAELTRWLVEFIEVDGVNIVGGCCGTTPAHLAAVVDAVGKRAPKPVVVTPSPFKGEGGGEGQRLGERESTTIDGHGLHPSPNLSPQGERDSRKAQSERDVVAARPVEFPNAARARVVKSEPSVASLYQAVPLAQESAVLAIGERTNANGSKKFRELLAAGDVDGMVQMAREQVKHGSHLLDVCTAYVGRDEIADMTAVIKRFVTDVTVPLVIDSTEPPVIEAALKLAGGKCVINSINLEDGEDRLDRLCKLAKRHGAALIALTIDEEGMAKTADRKVAVAKRIYDLAVNRHRVRPTDLIFDPLTFTICTGNEDDRKLGLETLEGIARIKEECPGAHALLGLSNISFGLKAPARRVLNSVYLHHARDGGLDAAIMHVTGIVPLYKIDDDHRRIAEDLIFDRRRDGYDPLQELIRAFESVDTTKSEQELPKRVEDRLKLRIINGNRVGLEEDLEEAMLTFRPLDIINDILLDGMKTVGDLFGAGQMQLPFVLQSAETMKAAVGFLEPHLDRADTAGKGTIVLATVRGDVHDIGKNLVDIILTNNGYLVHNLGIKQPISTIIEAYEKFGADVIGLSGLLVKSTVVMRENLQVLNERGLNPPVILGGAALTRKYVEQDLRPEYKGNVFYAKDAFAGLDLMDRIVSETSKSRNVEKSKHGERERGQQELGERKDSLSANRGVEAALSEPGAQATGLSNRQLPIANCQLADQQQSSIGNWKSEIGNSSSLDLHSEAVERHGYVPPQSNITRDEPVPQPPFWGRRVVEHLDARAALAYLNENMLFQVQWGFRKNRRGLEEFQRYLSDEVRPILRRLLDQCEKENILQLKAAYGFWPAQSDGDTLLIYHPNDPDRQLAAFEFPRMRKPPYWCLSDFFKPVSSGAYDVAAFSVVTAGRRVSEVARAWFAENRYQDYLYLHGLGVECAEALAEYIHKQIRVEWNIAGSDARGKQEIFKQHYQGSRYSFGYPACPRLEDQVKLWPLLEPQRIGVTLSEEFQLEPEQTTTALIVHHRQAKYFNVR